MSAALLVFHLGLGKLGSDNIFLRRTLAGLQVSQASFIGAQELARLYFGRGFRLMVESE